MSSSAVGDAFMGIFVIRAHVELPPSRPEVSGNASFPISSEHRVSSFVCLADLLGCYAVVDGNLSDTSAKFSHKCEGKSISS